MFALDKALKNEFGPENRRGNLLLGYGVMFPDVEFDATGCEATSELVYDLKDTRLPITRYINRLAEFARSSQSSKKYSPSRADVKSVANFLRGDFEAIPPMAAIGIGSREQLIRLTETQVAAFDVFERNRAVIVEGGAGTGKTLLAIEAARREARQGRRILLLCFNKLLAGFLGSILRGEGENLTVGGIYPIMDRLIQASSFREEFESVRKSTENRDLYARHYPEYAQLAVLDGAVRPYDVLIVDEGQDMLSHAMLDLWDVCLSGSLEGGRWRVFLDSNNQAAVYGVQDPDALERLRRFGQTNLLSINCRNTVEIADETFMLAAPRIRAVGMSHGVPVEYLWYADGSNQRNKLVKLLDRLAEQRISAGRITILSPRREEKCCAIKIVEGELERLSPGNVHTVVSGASSRTTFASVSAFKGLENDYVILTDIENLESDWWKSVVYVGMSRARLGLFLLIHESMHPIYERRLKSWAVAREV